MKKALILLVLLLLPLAAMADSFDGGDRLEVVNCELAPLFSLPAAGQESQVLAWIPAYEYVTYVGKIPEGYVVTTASMTGYMLPYYLEKAEYYDYGYADHEGTDPTDFPYSPIRCVANQRIATRSGPGTRYTEPGSFFKKGTELKVFYQADGSGVPWGYIEFTYKNQLYRAYTGMKRLDVNQVVPHCEEEIAHYVTLTESFKPYYGPGYNYATLPKAVSQNAQVPVFFTDNYWVMFDYTLPNGQIQRGWAPPECWTY